MKIKSINSYSINTIQIPRKIFLIISTLTVFAIGCRQPDPDSGLSFQYSRIRLDREVKELVGKVHSVYSFDTKNNGDSTSKLTIYNIAGSAVIFAYGKAKNGYFEYDTIWTRRYTYDTTGNITKSMMFFPGRRTSAATISYKYDRYGNPLEEDRFDYTINYKYSRIGKYVKMKRHRGIQFLDETVLNKHGDRIEYTSESVKQMFNKAGRLIRHYEKDTSGNYQITEIYNRNSRGFITEISFPNTSRTNKLNYFNHDSTGNWIKRKWIKMNGDVYDTIITRRRIKYY